MIKQTKLEDLIKEKIPFSLVDARGFHCCKCAHCNDYKVRAGFKFEDGNVIYNCWNCSTTSVYEEFSGKISKKMREVLNAFGLDDTEISGVVNTAFFFKKPEEPTISLASLKKISTLTPTIKLPDKSFWLGEHPDFIDYQLKLAEYLNERKVDMEKYPFYFSLDPRMIDRVIIPFYRQGNLIYWQARSINPSVKKRYDNAIVPRDAVMFNMDALNYYSKAPLFITEGVFDAMMIGGVALIGSKISEAKMELLKKSHRRLIFLIDKDSNGAHLAVDALKQGWEITFAADGAEDLNHSVERFGLIWSLNELMKNVRKTSDEARMAISLNCTEQRGNK
jgi:hypothetical protein